MSRTAHFIFLAISKFGTLEKCIVEKIIRSETSAIPTADWTEAIRPSLLYKLARRFGVSPDILSFAGGAPAPDLYPTAGLAAAAESAILAQNGALSYGRDLPELKSQIIDLMALRGIDCTADQISITSGGQHAMDLITRLFLNPHGQVMLEELVYTGIQQSVMPLQPEILSVPVDPREGLDLDVIEGHLSSGARPAFLYTIPEAHNPAGVTLSTEKRVRLVDIARQYNMPIIEDDAYGFLTYDDIERPPLRAIEENLVIYMGTFSKILSPGLRLGWIIAPTELSKKLQVLQQLSQLCVAILSQHIASTFIATNDFPAHIEHLRCEYKKRRNAMLDAMEAHFPKAVKWSTPTGGMFVWVELPEGIDTYELVERVVEEAGVAYIPGKAFVTDPKNTRYDNFMRLSFAKYKPVIIKEGIARLGTVLKKVIG